MLFIFCRVRNEPLSFAPLMHGFVAVWMCVIFFSSLVSKVKPYPCHVLGCAVCEYVWARIFRECFQIHSFGLDGRNIYCVQDKGHLHPKPIWYKTNERHMLTLVKSIDRHCSCVCVVVFFGDSVERSRCFFHFYTLSPIPFLSYVRFFSLQFSFYAFPFGCWWCPYMPRMYLPFAVYAVFSAVSSLHPSFTLLTRLSDGWHQFHTFIVCSIFAGLFHFWIYIWMLCVSVCTDDRRFFKFFFRSSFFASPFFLHVRPSCVYMWFFFVQIIIQNALYTHTGRNDESEKKNYFIKRKRKNAKNYEGRLAMWGG